MMGKHTMMIRKENLPEIIPFVSTPRQLHLQTISDILFLVVLSTLPFVSLDMCQITVKYNSIVEFL